MAQVKLPVRAFRGSGSGERPTAAQLGGALGLYVDTSETPYGVYVCRDNGSGTMAFYPLLVCDANGDVPVLGGGRQKLPFSITNVAAGDNAAVASSTPVAMQWAGAAAVGVSYTAMRAGSITGLSAKLSANAAGSDLIIQIFKNGTLVNALTLVTIASGSDEARTTFTKDTYTFAAGDNLDLRVLTSSSWSATTADLGAVLEFED